MSAREDLIAELQAQANRDAKSPPVVALVQYFAENTDEECIAPNQVGYGRPSLADFYAGFRTIQEREDVEGVFVGLHDDWREALKYPDDWPAAENIHNFTTAPADEVEEWISGLESDGAGEGWPYGKHPSAPEPPAGYQVMTIFWD